MTIKHVFSNPVADGAATTVVRPSDWNSAHVQAMTLGGNTAGVSEISGHNIVLQGGSNVTLSGAMAGTLASLVILAGGGSAAPFALADSNGISFGTNGSQVTASYTVPNVPAQSVQTQNLVSLLGSTGNIIFADSNGISFGGNASTVTASHNGLTTAAQSGHSHGNPTLALTNLSGTTASASNGLTLSLSAAAPGGGGGAALSAGTQSVSTGTVAFANSNGITFGMSGSNQITASHNGLTTAMQSGASANFAATGFTTTTGAGAVIAGTHDTAGLKLAVPAFLTTAQAPGAYLTTARASNDAIGLNSAITQNGVSMTANSSGLSLNFPAFLTTAAQSGHSHGNPTLALTNLSGTTASASNGLTLSLSAAGGGVTNQTGPNIAAGTQTATSGTVVFANSNEVTFGMSGSSQITASFNPINIGMSTDGNTAGTTGTVDGAGAQFLFAGGNNITLSQSVNGKSHTLSIVAAAGGAGVTHNAFIPFGENVIFAAGQVGQNSIHVQPFGAVPAFSHDRLALALQFSQATNSTLTVSCTVDVGIYTRNVSTLSRLTSYQGSFSINGSGTASSAMNSGPRWATMGMSGSASGDFWVAFRSSTATAGNNATLSNLLLSHINSVWSGLIGVSTNQTRHLYPGQGVWSTTSNNMPASMAFSHISGAASLSQRQPIFFMTNGTHG